MTEGLITRIGRWIDRKWEATPTYSELRDQESRCGQRHAAALNLIAELGQKIDQAPSSDQAKDLHDLKTRIEKIELYSGMTRKVDPTKPPVVKSAFAM